MVGLGDHHEPTSAQTFPEFFEIPGVGDLVLGTDRDEYTAREIRERRRIQQRRQRSHEEQPTHPRVEADHSRRHRCAKGIAAGPEIPLGRFLEEADRGKVVFVCLFDCF